ncbi:MAG: hypothetical protein N0E48_25005, partial [Candidatus Thiodiazotropha endolucinida]|nr:hypothetical protein [Candidatus Thiodiazotropha taylori]MCW4346585.1 hypothetical protein [Candidatus Thiodiazotropha endolucinida]
MKEKVSNSENLQLQNKNKKPFIRTKYAKIPPAVTQKYRNLDKKKVTNIKISNSTDSKEKTSTSEDKQQGAKKAGVFSSVSAPSCKTQKQHNRDNKGIATKNTNVEPLDNNENRASSCNSKQNADKPEAFASDKVLPTESLKQCKPEEKSKVTNNVGLLTENGRHEEPRTNNQNENMKRKGEDPQTEGKPASGLSFSETLKKSPKQIDNQSDKVIDNFTNSFNMPQQQAVKRKLNTGNESVLTTKYDTSLRVDTQPSQKKKKDKNRRKSVKEESDEENGEGSEVYESDEDLNLLTGNNENGDLNSDSDVESSSDEETGPNIKWSNKLKKKGTKTFRGPEPGATKRPSTNT